jgi:ArsR family transcriptional regulator, arsenate/arsenite/antimonite-responsive transcriptional repressor / arsenate reductase (thioredoxin)
MLSESQVIGIFKALADPNRLALFRLLLASDLTNSEMMDQTGLRQNLLSHHLTILVESGLVRVQRSIGDARRHYFSANLAQVQHFSAWWEGHVSCSPDREPTLPALRRPRRVLFLCRRNSARSLMAEALARHLAPQALITFSAGIEAPEEALPEVAVRALAEHGISTAGLVGKTLAGLSGQPFDQVITVCDTVHEGERTSDPILEGVRRAHWSLNDPLEAGPTPGERYQSARDLLAELRLRLTCLVHRLAAEEAAEA